MYLSGVHAFRNKVDRDCMNECEYWHMTIGAWEATSPNRPSTSETSASIILCKVRLQNTGSWYDKPNLCRFWFCTQNEFVRKALYVFC